MAERIQKVLADAGIGSRRQIEALIRQGRIVVDGRLARLGERVAGSERLLIDGHPVKLDRTSRQRRQYHLAYYKPAGEITSRADAERRPTVFTELTPPPTGRWITVGRLDINTSGLLLMTTDGELAHRLMHPRFQVPREYAVRLLGSLTRKQRDELLKGVVLEDGQAKLDDISAEGGSGTNTWYRATLHEGRNREVRRLFDAVGLPVSRLIRVRYGPVSLGGLRRGESRRLSREEISALYAAVDLKTERRGRDRRHL